DTYIGRIIPWAGIAAFAALSAAATFGSLHNGRSFDRLNPLATTNQVLAVLDLPNPAESLKKALDRFGSDESLLFIGSSKEPFTLQVYYTVLTLAYPRRVGAVICGEIGKTEDSIIGTVPGLADIRGLIFFDVDPGFHALGGERLAPKLYISGHQGAASWRSFCR